MKIVEAFEKIVAWLRNFFEGPNGESSSKRLAAFVYIAASLYSGIVNKDMAVAGVYVGAATMLLGVSAVTRT